MLLSEKDEVARLNHANDNYKESIEILSNQMLRIQEDEALREQQWQDRRK